MNQITTRPTTHSPSTTTRVTEVAPLTGDDLTRLQRLGNALERTADGRWQMPDTALLADGERRWLEDRQAVLRRSLLRANRDAIAALVAGMFLRFPPTGQAGDTEGRIAAYVADLQGFPLWAIERAILGLRGQYSPASNILADVVRAVLAPTSEELAKLQRLLTADVYHVPSDSERERVKARFESLIADLKLRNAFDKPAAKPSPYASPQNSRQQAQAWLAEQAGDPSAPPAMSDALRRSLGIEEEAAA